MPQNEDGREHLAYFDSASRLSYVWDGRSCVIEVCVGGYGERPARLAKAPEARGNFAEVLAAFRRTCQLDAAQHSTWPLHSGEATR